MMGRYNDDEMRVLTLGLMLAIVLAACGADVACSFCTGDGRLRCKNLRPNPNNVKCEDGTIVCDPEFHNPIESIGFCVRCGDRDGKEHAKCGGTGILDKPCTKCDGTGRVRS